MSNEIWKDIKFVNKNGNLVDYTGRYQISSKGRIKRMSYVDSNGKLHRSRIMSKRLRTDGYEDISLTDLEHKRHTYKVHRIVALVFIPNPNNLSDVNHIDENRSNNCVSNLEWLSHYDNNNYGTRNKKISLKLKGNKNKQSVPVYCITNNTIYNSAYEAANVLKLERGNIIRCCKNKQTHTGGFQFKYYQ